MRAFGRKLISVEIDGNTYHLPDSLTPGARIDHHKLITPYVQAQEAVTLAIRKLQIAGKKADDAGLGAADEDFVAAEKALREASKAVPDAARGLIVGLLEPVAASQKIPEKIEQHITDDSAIEYAETVVDGGRVEPDPT